MEDRWRTTDHRLSNHFERIVLMNAPTRCSSSELVSCVPLAARVVGNGVPALGLAPGSTLGSGLRVVCASLQVASLIQSPPIWYCERSMRWCCSALQMLLSVVLTLNSFRYRRVAVLQKVHCERSARQSNCSGCMAFDAPYFECYPCDHHGLKSLFVWT